MTTTAEDILSKKTVAKRISLSDLAQGTLAGAAVGCVGGFIYAYYREKTYWSSMLIGTLIGSVVSGVFIGKK